MEENIFLMLSVHGGHTPILQKIALKVLGNHILLLVVKGVGVPTSFYPFSEKKSNDT